VVRVELEDGWILELGEEVRRHSRHLPNEAAVARLTDAILLEQSCEWTTHHAYYMTLETIGAVSDTAPVSLPIVAA
jgi:hypothetical protein